MDSFDPARLMDWSVSLIAKGLEGMEGELGSSYDLVLLAAQRARQIQEGAPPLLRTASTHPLTVALEEITAGLYPPPAKESLPPKDLDEDFIDAALALQGLENVASRFDSTLLTLPDTSAEDASPVNPVPEGAAESPSSGVVIPDVDG